MKTLEQHYNLVNIVRERLQKDIVDAIVEPVVQEELRKFEEVIRVRIRKEAEKVALTGIDTMDDILRARQELIIYLKWSDEEDKLEVTST
ncbi:MAG: hypothetical protein GQ570_03545 [Helicobacteraceae bacterium]|nr:hypothetical protein [Helicobacteraceae bacterium]